MKIKKHSVPAGAVAEVIADGTVLTDTHSLVELVINCYYDGCDGMVIYQESLPPEFFELKTGRAGELLQKFSTYQMRLAIVGDFSHYESKSLRDFIYESNKVGRINFVDSLRVAIEKLGHSPT